MGMTDTDLLDFAAQASEVLVLAQAVLTLSAGEVARRSESSLPEPLSRQHGEKSAAALLAVRSRLPERELAIHAKLGLALSPREGLTGEVLPPFFEQAADAVAAGRLSAAAAKLIVATLEKVEPHASAGELVDLERILVTGASDMWSSRTLSDVCRAVPDRFDPDGAEPREAMLRGKRGARRLLLDDGTIRWILDFDPESAAYFEAALDARTAPRRQGRFVEVSETDPDTDSDHAYTDDRTLEQKRLDAVVDIARDSLRGDDGEISGVDTTVVVHIDAGTLMGSVGAASIEGVEAPISAATARRMAADAGIIPLVLGGDGVPIDVGATQRFFTPAQRRAMAARDGGCVWPDCTAPPRWCDAAHIAPWARTKRTDLRNGVLLCHYHHRRFDTDGWQLRFDDGVPVFIPPAHIDGYRTPRAGGNLSGSTHPLRGVISRRS